MLVINKKQVIAHAARRDDTVITAFLQGDRWPEVHPAKDVTVIGRAVFQLPVAPPSAEIAADLHPM